jgi:hypothetical protein
MMPMRMAFFSDGGAARLGVERYAFDDGQSALLFQCDRHWPFVHNPKGRRHRRGRVRRILGFGLLGIAALLLVLELMALADPVGTKLADDSDPFGDPHQPWWFHALWFAIVALLAAAGARLTRRGNVRRDRAPNATSR